VAFIADGLKRNFPRAAPRRTRWGKEAGGDRVIGSVRARVIAIWNYYDLQLADDRLAFLFPPSARAAFIVKRPLPLGNVVHVRRVYKTDTREYLLVNIYAQIYLSPALLF
jgi:hypothetical protein